MDKLKELTCTMCNEVQQTFSEIVYSTGDRVCLSCKKDTQSSDNKSFDTYIMNTRSTAK